MLHVQLFGPPLIKNASDSLAQFKSRKVWALLFYLAITPGQHRRMYLADLLWSESSEEKALSNLRYALWNLRQVLGELPVRGGRLNISFQQSDDIWIDVNAFRELLKTADINTNAVMPESITRLQQAVDLYRGELLAGFEVDEAPDFERWLHQQRMALHEMVIDALSRLSAYYSSHHYLPEAIAAMRRLLELEPWHEAGHRQMMLLLALAGQRDAALNQYQHCRQVLAAELNLEPEPETTAQLFNQAGVDKGTDPVPPVRRRDNDTDQPQLRRSFRHGVACTTDELPRDLNRPNSFGSSHECGTPKMHERIRQVRKKLLVIAQFSN